MRNRKNSSGFTLIEVAVSGVLIVVLGVGILGLQYVLGKTQLTAFSSYVSSDEANVIVEMISRELRTARAGDNGAFLIESGAADSITYFSDVDFDGATERVQYVRSGNTMTRNVWEPTGYPVTYPESSRKTRILSSNIRNLTVPVFTYYNGSWPTDTTNNPLPTPVDLLAVKLVKIYLRTNERANAANTDFTADSFASLRMAKNNL